MTELDRLVGEILEHVTLDGLVVSVNDMVGRLDGEYLRAISLDLNLSISKFLRIAECLPHYARDGFGFVVMCVLGTVACSTPSPSIFRAIILWDFGLG
ncbi:hypothetical protein RIF29_23358 [Crotalaria pallida]|uniref:NPH3 domain-containing protein n=1 Tax=Crotalaria pallida TaxID=3830 RepID=A0AAN9I8J8_CROPI